MAHGRYDLTEFEWNVIKPPLPNKARGVPRVDDRRVERHFLSAKVRFALGRFAREIWARRDEKLPVCTRLQTVVVCCCQPRMVSMSYTFQRKQPGSKKNKSKDGEFEELWQTIQDDAFNAFLKRLRQSSASYREVHDEMHNHKLAKILAKTDWSKVSKRKAVEIYEYRLQLRHGYNFGYGKDDPRSQIPCPVEFEALILEAALLGMHKGTSKNKRPPNRYMKNYWVTLMQAFGREIKAELIADGIPTKEAEEQAAKKIHAELAQHVDIKSISWQSLAEMLKRRPKFQSVRRFLTPDI